MFTAQKDFHLSKKDEKPEVTTHQKQCVIVGRTVSVSVFMAKVSFVLCPHASVGVFTGKKLRGGFQAEKPTDPKSKQTRELITTGPRTS